MEFAAGRYRNGLHIYVRIEPRWGFAELRRAAHAFAREVERRAPDEATTTWWRKDRHPGASTTPRTAWIPLLDWAERSGLD